jgi:hypothetical protein
MKIKSETADQISLYDRSSGPFVGPLLVIVGVGVFFIHTSASSPHWVVPTIAAVLIIVGFAMLLFSPSFTVDVTKSEIHYQRNALAGKHIDQTYNSSDVSQIIVQESINQSYNSNMGNNPGMPMRTNIKFQTFLLFKDGLQLPIDNGSSSASMVGIIGGSGNKEISIAQKVATLLGVPMQGGRSPLSITPNDQL